MMINEVKGLHIKGVAACVPTRSVRPDDYVDVLGAEAVDSFKKASGVTKRHMVTEKKAAGEMSVWQTAGDLSCAAAKRLLDHFGVDPKDVGILVFVSQSRDYTAPCTACVLQHRLGMSESSVAFDVPLGCSGYGYGVNVAASLMSTSDAKYALALVADTQAGLSDLNGVTCSDTLLMGDSGTATLLERGDQTLTFMSRTDGWGFNKTGVVSRGFRYPFAPKGKFFMDDIDVFHYITTTGPEIINAYMEHMGTTPDDYDCFALHQASAFSLKQVSRRIKAKMDKIPLSITEYGNTGPASIPMTLCYRYGEEKGSKVKVLMSGFGVGLSAAAFSAELDVDGILPITETDEWFDDKLF